MGFQLTWHAARRQSNLVVSSGNASGADGMETDSTIDSAAFNSTTPKATRRAIAELLCHWAMLRDASGTLGTFLMSVLEDEVRWNMQFLVSATCGNKKKLFAASS